MFLSLEIMLIVIMANLSISGVSFVTSFVFSIYIVLKIIFKVHSNQQHILYRSLQNFKIIIAVPVIGTDS